MRKSPMVKRFRLDASEIRQIVTGHGFCMASDHITVEGKRVGFMYPRRAPNFLRRGPLEIPPPLN